MKKIITIKTAIIAIIAIITTGSFFAFPNFKISNLFKEQPIVIDKTDNVVAEIRRLSEFTTAFYCGNNVIYKKKKKDLLVFGQTLSTLYDELVIITTGKVRAGFDFSEIQEQDISVQDTIISLKLPHVKILDIITNPSDFETFEESGKWSHEEVVAFKNEARALIEKNALDNGILKLAEENAIDNLTRFLSALGFKEININ